MRCSSIVDANGEVRNELWIPPTVGCVNGIARQIQNRFLKETNEAERHRWRLSLQSTYGCSQLGDDHINTRTHVAKHGASLLRGRCW